jgi:hypothetical protein
LLRGRAVETGFLAEDVLVLWRVLSESPRLFILLTFIEIKLLVY